ILVSSYNIRSWDVVALSVQRLGVGGTRDSDQFCSSHRTRHKGIQETSGISCRTFLKLNLKDRFYIVFVTGTGRKHICILRNKIVLLAVYYFLEQSLSSRPVFSDYMNVCQ